MRLNQVRTERRPHSSYASFDQCSDELRRADAFTTRTDFRPPAPGPVVLAGDRATADSASTDSASTGSSRLDVLPRPPDPSASRERPDPTCPTKPRAPRRHLEPHRPWAVVGIHHRFWRDRQPEAADRSSDQPSPWGRRAQAIPDVADDLSNPPTQLTRPAPGPLPAPGASPRTVDPPHRLPAPPASSARAGQNHRRPDRVGPICDPPTRSLRQASIETEPSRARTGGGGRPPRRVDRRGGSRIEQVSRGAPTPALDHQAECHPQVQIIAQREVSATAGTLWLLLTLA